jgi:hypothetical protein
MTVSSDDDGALVAATDPFKRPVVLLSPIVTVGLGFVLARITDAIRGAWSWIPIIIYYWGILVAFIIWGGGRVAISRWLNPSRQSRWLWVWRVLSLAVPSLFLPTAFLSSLTSMNG